MTLNLRALAQFLRDICAACRPPADDLTAVMDATAEPTRDPLTDPCAPCDEYAAEFHRVVSEFAERMADRRVAEFGDEDFAEWSRELMFEDER